MRRGWMVFAAEAVVCWGFLGAVAGESAWPPQEKAPPRGEVSSKVYHVAWLPGAKIVLDGKLEEEAWQKAELERRFTFPWAKKRVPATSFRALCDGTNLFFGFAVEDADIVVLDKLQDKEDEVFEDRVEMYFSVDEAMKNYFCFEVDSRGRAFDYRGSFWRKLGHEVEVGRAGDERKNAHGEL